MAATTHTHGGSTHTHEDLSYAGQGSVLLDIGGGYGAVVMAMPAGLEGVEIEMCPAGEDHAAAPRPHVAVLRRPAGTTVIHSAVFPSVAAGRYELYRKSDGPTEVTVEVRSGAVARATWPAA